MPKEVTIKLYEYDELSDSAKAKAREWYREISREGNDFADTYGHNVIEDAARLAEIIGIDIADHPVPLHGGGTRRDPSIWWQLGYMQSDGVWIEGTIRHAKGGARKIRTEAPEDTTLHDLADRLAALQKRYGYRLTATVKDDSRNAMQVEIDVTGAIRREVTSETYTEIREIVREFSSWIYNNLRAEDEYADKDDTIEENIRANEYTFREDGRRSDG